MTRYKPPKPTIIQVSPKETLIVFPYNPKASRATGCNLPFEEIKHLLSDKPLTPPYRGDLPRESRRTPNGKPKGATKRKPKQATTSKPKRAIKGKVARQANLEAKRNPRGTRRRKSRD
jgi:hypothetical protein